VKACRFGLLGASVVRFAGAGLWAGTIGN
jgi:hypothetical protein